MDETTAYGGGNDAPLAKNEYVQELYSILQDHGRDTTGLSALIGHVSEMEDFVKRAEDKITDMKSQLAEMKEAQNHPVKTALQKAIKSLENTVAVMKAQIRDLKNSVIDGCKQAVQAFKERGISALDKLASFFHIKGAFKAIDKTAQANIAVCDRGIAHQTAYYAELYKASRAIRNMGRLLIGKEPLPSQSETRRLEKVATAPYRAEKAVNVKISELANDAIKAFERLEAATEAKRDNSHRTVLPVREKKPKLLEELRDAQQLVAERKLEMPVPERVKVKEAVEV
jgi:cell division protein FtsB